MVETVLTVDGNRNTIFMLIQFPLYDRIKQSRATFETSHIIVLAMKYISTRGSIREYSFTEAFLNTYADDGGLFCPKEIPHIPKETLEKWSV